MTPDMTPADVSTLLDAYVVQPWGSGNFAELDATVAEDFALLPDGLDLEALKLFITDWRRALPDLTYTVEETITEGDRIAFRWTMTGTHRAEIEGVAPTGKRVTYTGITILYLREGKIVGDRYESGSPGLAQQVGATVSGDTAQG